MRECTHAHTHTHKKHIASSLISLLKGTDLQAAIMSTCTFGSIHRVFLGPFVKKLSKIVTNSNMIM